MRLLRPCAHFFHGLMYFLLKQEVGSRIISKGMYLYFEQAILLFKSLNTIFFTFLKKKNIALTKVAFIIYKLDQILVYILF